MEPMPRPRSVCGRHPEDCDSTKERCALAKIPSSDVKAVPGVEKDRSVKEHARTKHKREFGRGLAISSDVLFSCPHDLHVEEESLSEHLSAPSPAPLSSVDETEEDEATLDQLRTSPPAASPVHQARCHLLQQKAVVPPTCSLEKEYGKDLLHHHAVDTFTGLHSKKNDEAHTVTQPVPSSSCSSKTEGESVSLGDLLTTSSMMTSNKPFNETDDEAQLDAHSIASSTYTRGTMGEVVYIDDEFTTSFKNTTQGNERNGQADMTSQPRAPLRSASHAHSKDSLVGEHSTADAAKNRPQDNETNDKAPLMIPSVASTAGSLTTMTGEHATPISTHNDQLAETDAFSTSFRKEKNGVASSDNPDVKTATSSCPEDEDEKVGARSGAQNDPSDCSHGKNLDASTNGQGPSVSRSNGPLKDTTDGERLTGARLVGSTSDDLRGNKHNGTNHTAGISTHFTSDCRAEEDTHFGDLPAVSTAKCSSPPDSEKKEAVRLETLSSTANRPGEDPGKTSYAQPSKACDALPCNYEGMEKKVLPLKGALISSLDKRSVVDALNEHFRRKLELIMQCNVEEKNDEALAKPQPLPSAASSSAHLAVRKKEQDIPRGSPVKESGASTKCPEKKLWDEVACSKKLAPSACRKKEKDEALSDRGTATCVASSLTTDSHKKKNEDVPTHLTTPSGVSFTYPYESEDLVTVQAGRSLSLETIMCYHVWTAAEATRDKTVSSPLSDVGGGGTDTKRMMRQLGLDGIEGGKVRRLCNWFEEKHRLGLKQMRMNEDK